MPIIQRPSPLNSSGFLTASNTLLLVSAASNVRGVTIDRAVFSWFLGAINASVLAQIQNSSTNEFCATTYADNGPTGPINIPAVASYERQTQFAPGLDVNLSVVIVGTARLMYALNLRIL